jgi:hypothetical protein
VTETDYLPQWSCSDIEKWLWNNYETTRRFIYQADKKIADLRAQMQQERLLSQEKHSTLYRENDILRSRLAAAERKMCGEQEMEEHQTQPNRWLMQGAHTRPQDGASAMHQALERSDLPLEKAGWILERAGVIAEGADSTDSLATAGEKQHSSTPCPSPSPSVRPQRKARQGGVKRQRTGV